MKEIIQWITCLILAIIIALLLKHFVFTPTLVKQVSMQPTLENGDRLILDRLSITLNKEIKRGEIITFEAPIVTSVDSTNYDEEKPVAIYSKENMGIFQKFMYYTLEINKESYIKRVIGVSGDKILIEDGNVYVNGTLLEEDYLPEDAKTMRTGLFYDLTVPDGHVFAMGDNRMNSKDCRNFGCIPLSKIEGKVLCRIYPFDKFGKIPNQ